MLRFEPITEFNYRECMRLKVKKSQTAFVDNSNYIALAKAYVYRDTVHPYVLYFDDTMIGFLQYREMPHLNNYLLDKIMIHANFQGNGFGTQAMQMLIERLKKESLFRKLCLCVQVDNAEALHVYEKFGFTQCEEEEEREIVLGIEW